MSRSVLGGLLLAMWLLLWGQPSVANVASGVVVVALLYAVFPSERPYRPRAFLHPLDLARLLGYFLRQVVVSNLLVAREIASPHSHLEAHIIDVPMRTTSPGFLTLITYITALTPGTMALGIRTGPPVITLHALVLADADAVEVMSRSLWRLEELCVRAFGTAEAVAELARERAPSDCTAREVPVPLAGSPREAGR